jgi:hypothetical protein
MERVYEINPQSLDTKQQVLEWKLAGLRCVIAIDKNSSELERLKGLHIKLRKDIRSIPALQVLVEARRDLRQLGKALERELRKIEHLPKFPGRCGFWSG